MTALSNYRWIVGRVERLSKEELVVLLRKNLEEFNKEEKTKDRKSKIENDYEPDENWDDINEQISRSNIKRYSWSRIIGESLTKRILKLREKGLTPEETIDVIWRCPGVRDFLKEFPKEDKNMGKNIRINVHARYGENKTADKVRRQNERSN